MSAAINEIAIRSPVAAVNSGTSLRVYQLANDGGVREAAFEPGRGWWGGGADSTVGAVKLTSPLSATSLGRLDSIRVYGVADDDTVKEICYDADRGWYVGGMAAARFRVAPYSAVAGVFIARAHKLRVYVQIPDDTIQEYSYDGETGKGWYKDQNLGPALPGTSIAVVTWGASAGDVHLRVYFQDKSLNVIEKAHDPASTWYDGGLRFPAPVPRTPLAAVNWDGGSHIRVYWGRGSGSDKVAEKAHDDGRAWYDGAFSHGGGVPGTRVAALQVGAGAQGGSGPGLRVYLQDGADVTAFTEFAYVDGRWVAGAKALPPAGQ